MIERDVKARVKALIADYAPSAYLFMPVQTGYGAPSLDFIVTIQGISLYIETKVDGKKPSPRQKLTVQKMVEAGAVVTIVDQHNLDDLSEVIRGLERREYQTAHYLAQQMRDRYITK